MAGLSLPQVSTMDILAYMEHLLQSGMSASNITNHIAGIRAMFVVYGLNPTILTDNRIVLFLKSVRINRPLQPHIVLSCIFHSSGKKIAYLPSFKSPSSFSGFLFILHLFIFKTV